MALLALALLAGWAAASEPEAIIHLESAASIGAAVSAAVPEALSEDGEKIQAVLEGRLSAPAPVTVGKFSGGWPYWFNPAGTVSASMGRGATKVYSPPGGVVSGAGLGARVAVEKAVWKAVELGGDALDWTKEKIGFFGAAALLGITVLFPLIGVTLAVAALLAPVGLVGGVVQTASRPD